MTLPEAIVYGTTALVVGVYLVDATRPRHWCGMRLWLWSKGCPRCRDEHERRFG